MSPSSPIETSLVVCGVLALWCGAAWRILRRVKRCAPPKPNSDGSVDVAFEDESVRDLAWLVHVTGVEAVWMGPESTVYVVADGSLDAEGRIWLERVVRQSSPIGQVARVVARRDVPAGSKEISRRAA